MTERTPVAESSEDAARRLAEELLRELGLPIHNKRLVAVLAYGRARERAALEKAAKKVGTLMTCITPKEHHPAWCASCDVRQDAYDHAAESIRSLLEE